MQFDEEGRLVGAAGLSRAWPPPFPDWRATGSMSAVPSTRDRSIGHLFERADPAVDRETPEIVPESSGLMGGHAQ